MNDRDTATSAHHRGPRRPPVCAALGLVLVAALAVATLVLAAPGAGAAAGGAPAGAGGPLYSWQENGGTQSATLHPAQVQVFLKRGVKPATVGRRLAKRAAGQGEAAPTPQTVGHGRLLVQVPAAGESPTDRVRRARSALLADSSVADVGAVFYAGSVTAAHRLVTTGELVARFRASVTSAQRDALCAQLGLRQLRAYPFAPGIWSLKAATPLDVFAAAAALDARLSSSGRCPPGTAPARSVRCPAIRSSPISGAIR